MIAEPWRPLLDRALEAVRHRRGGGPSVQLDERLENEPKRGRQGYVRDFELQARRARRRAHGRARLQPRLVSLWFRDLIAVASRREAQDFFDPRSRHQLAADARATPIASSPVSS